MIQGNPYLGAFCWISSNRPGHTDQRRKNKSAFSNLINNDLDIHIRAKTGNKRVQCFSAIVKGN